MSLTSPTDYKPTSPEQLIGHSRSFAHLLMTKARRIKESGKGNLKAILLGPPGVGKSETAMMVSRFLSGHELAIESLNGQSMSVERVRKWRDDANYHSLYGDRVVKVVDEIDCASEQAQAELLSFLDKLPKHADFIGTSNKSLEQFPERLQTRMTVYPFSSVTIEDIGQFIHVNWIQDRLVAFRIAEASRGCVRAALIDTEAQLDRMALAGGVYA